MGVGERCPVCGYGGVPVKLTVTFGAHVWVAASDAYAAS
jgi:hypothetical protein